MTILFLTMSENAVGLPNLGNTCYANSIIQILSSLVDIVCPKNLYAKNGVSEKEYVMAGNLFRLIEEVRNGVPDKRTVIQTFLSVAKRYPQFATGQHDQNEYLNSILEVMHNCSSYPLNMVITKPERDLSYEEKLELTSFNNMRVDGSGIVGTNYVKDDHTLMNSSIFENFTGQLLTRTKCVNPACEFISDTLDVFRTLEVSIKHNCQTLEDCLDNYVKTTQLGDSDTNKCKCCKVDNQSYIKRQIWRAPNILVISLKRFVAKDINGGITMTKINKRIAIPDILDVSDYECIPGSRQMSSKYQLMSIAHHFGGMGCGHCYSHVKKNGQWYLLDDDDVKRVPAPTGADAYMIFYQRID